MRLKILTTSLLISILVTAISYSQQSVTLPQKTGSLNDYAAVLGPDSRKTLQDLLTSLQTHGNMHVTILFSRLDPYSNLQQFSEALWQSWELEAERSVLLLFVTEEDVWNFHWKTSPALGTAFTEPAITEALADVEEAVADRRVSQAAIDFLALLTSLYVVILEEPVVETPLENIQPNSESTEPPSTNETSPPLVSQPPDEDSNSFLSLPIGVWYTLGGIGLALLLLILIRAAFLSSCPKCGGQMKKRVESASYSQLQRRSTQKREARVVYYCPQCRYQR